MDLDENGFRVVRLVGPSFPEPGSRIGKNGRFFTLGRLGRGTFCSIHRCIDLGYFHEDGTADSKPKERIVAAKVELACFSNSGVLDGEATILQHLSSSIPRHVPTYLDHVRDESNQFSAIVMEYLNGRDMHQLRDMYATHRRLSLDDAVYLCADVLLTLLEQLHSMGVVHRDVKPSNCVWYKDKLFKLVDFGLSKSILVSSNKKVYRKERESAEFRGTSMYASLKIHQNKDYCFRDDIWGLLYVFCDLVSGGLPWMSHAALRDRKACQLSKERIHSSRNEYELLQGADYHVAKFKKISELPQPLALSKDDHKIKMLQDCFQHVASLSFTDTPNYNLIREKMISFAQHSSCPELIQTQDVRSIPWHTLQQKQNKQSSSSNSISDSHMIHIPSHPDPLHLVEDNVWKEAENQQPLPNNTTTTNNNNNNNNNTPASNTNTNTPNTVNNTGNNNAPNSNNGSATSKMNEDEIGCLPLLFQYRLAQMEYNARNASSIKVLLALRDWMACAAPLVEANWWNVCLFERHAHQRHNEDGYRRDLFLKLIQYTLDCAAPFHYFRFVDCLEAKTSHNTQSSYQLRVSITLHSLRYLLDEEKEKLSAPPPTISFQYNNNNNNNTPNNNSNNVNGTSMIPNNNTNILPNTPIQS